MALDTFNPYLFVSSGEQSNKFLTPTYADGIAEFQAQRAQELTGLTVRIDPIQEGTGDPAPDNIRPISGRTGMTVTVQSGETQNEYPVTWETEAGTVYGGTLDVVSGRLTVDSVGIILDGTTHSFADRNTYWHIIPEDYGVIKTYRHNTQPEYVLSSFTMGVSKWGTTGNNSILFTRATNWTNIFNSVDDINNFITVTPQQLVVPIDTPQTYQLSPTDVKTLAGFNQIYSDAGPVIDIKF